MISFSAKIFDRVGEHVPRRDCTAVGLNFKVMVVKERMRVLVSSEADVGVAQQLHTQKIQNGVIFLVETKRSSVGDFCVGRVFDFPFAGAFV